MKLLTLYLFFVASSTSTKIRWKSGGLITLLLFPFARYYYIRISVGSNPKISNFELLRTLEVELRTQPNPCQNLLAELRTLEVKLRTLCYQ